jgi:hypothetical protein
MSVLKFPLLYKGSKGSADLVSLFDSGASFSCIHPDKAKELGNLEALPDVIHIQTASEAHEILVKYRVILDFYLNGTRLSDEFIVIPALSEEAIIGAATMQKWRIKLDFEHDSVWVDPKVAVAILK